MACLQSRWGSHLNNVHLWIILTWSSALQAVGSTGNEASPCCALGCVPSGLYHPRTVPSYPSWISVSARQVSHEGKYRVSRLQQRRSNRILGRVLVHPLLDVDAWTRWCRCTKGTPWEDWLDIHLEDEGHETHFVTRWPIVALTVREMTCPLLFHQFIWVLTDFQFLFLRSAFRYHAAFS